MITKPKILLVDDEEDILHFLQYNLVKEGYDVRTASNGKNALSVLQKFDAQLVLLDIMMPEMDGVELCEKIRSISKLQNLLICFLTARSDSFTQITALDKGGDDFITKPIKPRVLLSRINAILRRHPDLKQTQESVKTFGSLKVNFENYNLQIDDKKITLAKKEFELLKLLTAKPGRVYKREEILIKVWGSDVIVGDRTIDVHIRKLREKIGSEYIQTVKGVGYKFDF